MMGFRCINRGVQSMGWCFKWMLCHYSNILSLILNLHFLSLDWGSSQLYLLINSYYFPPNLILINSSLVCYKKALSFEINRTSTSRATTLLSVPHFAIFNSIPLRHSITSVSDQNSTKITFLRRISPCFEIFKYSTCSARSFTSFLSSTSP